MPTMHADYVQVGFDRFVLPCTLLGCIRVPVFPGVCLVKLERTAANGWLCAPPLVWLGIVMFLGGFFIWNMDNIFCHNLTATKNRILLPWSVVLEGHGWWHILTGLGMF